jgi:hypothetical protein
MSVHAIRNLLGPGTALGLSVGLLIGFQAGRNITERRVSNEEPEIGIDFVDRPYAEQLRRSGDLDAKILYSACRDAVDNYLNHGVTGEDGKVLVDLPRRDELRTHPRKYYNAPKTRSCDPG